MYQGNLSSVAFTALACLPSLPLPFVPFLLPPPFFHHLSHLSNFKILRHIVLLLPPSTNLNLIFTAENGSEHHGSFSARSPNWGASPDHRLLWPCYAILAITDMPDLQRNGSSKAAPLLRSSGKLKDFDSKRYGTLAKVSVIEKGRSSQPQIYNSIN